MVKIVDMTIWCQNDNEAMMSFSVEVLARIAIDLQSDIGHADRFRA
jgi:anaerobic nitric oxide reductase transcription regulator